MMVVVAGTRERFRGLRVANDGKVVPRHPSHHGVCFTHNGKTPLARMDTYRDVPRTLVQSDYLRRGQRSKPRIIADSQKRDVSVSVCTNVPVHVFARDGRQ